MIHVICRRLESLTRLPTQKEWGEACLAACLFAFVAVPLASKSDFINGWQWPGLGSALLLFGRVLVVPALLEEVVFRALLNPPPGRATLKVRLGWGAFSLCVYVAAHPLSALLFRPSAVDVFASPTFLLLAGLLGLLCLVLYVRSGSLWGSVTLHTVVVMGWALGGGLKRLAD